jgi:hypothetical protein
MPVPQSTYTATMAAGVEGMVATMWGGHTEIESRICETVAGISFGRAVSQGAGAKGAIVGGTAAGFLGVTVRDATLVTNQGQTVDLYQRYQNMGVINSGDIWVVAVNGCTVGAAATFDGTTGQINPAAGGLAIAGSKWLTSATAGNLACLRLTHAAP